MNVYRVDNFRKIGVDLKNLIIEIYEDGKFVCYLNHFRDVSDLRSYAKSQWNVTL